MRQLPPGALRQEATSVMVSVVTQKRPTYDSLIESTGLSRSQVGRNLRALRRLGLVDWEDGKRGTIRAVVQRVEIRR